MRLIFDDVRVLPFLWKHEIFIFGYKATSLTHTLSYILHGSDTEYIWHLLKIKILLPESLFLKADRKYFLLSITSGHILDLHCVGSSTASPFCMNYAKLYFDAKHLQKGWNFWGPIFRICAANLTWYVRDCHQIFLLILSEFNGTFSDDFKGNLKLTNSPQLAYY